MCRWWCRLELHYRWYTFLGRLSCSLGVDSPTLIWRSLMWSPLLRHSSNEDSLWSSFSFHFENKDALSSPLFYVCVLFLDSVFNYEMCSLCCCYILRTVWMCNLTVLAIKVNYSIIYDFSLRFYCQYSCQDWTTYNITRYNMKYFSINIIKLLSMIFK